MSDVNRLADALVQEIERRGERLDKVDYWELLEQISEELGMRQEAVSDELRNDGYECGPDRVWTKRNE